MQKLSTQTRPSGHGNSPDAHGSAHWQWVQVAPPPHSVPSSTWPLQLSSSQLQVSVIAGSPPWHT